jgi:PBP1b-binding outer membrane lipoprotein LpoB
MNAAMKLGALIFAAFAVAGCASSTCPAPAAKTSEAPVVSTTRLTSADLAETEYAPLVSKPEHAMAPAEGAARDEAAPPKDGRRRDGGGFSGWK